MSLTDTHYTDPSTGQKVEILLGQGNYNKWLREFKMAADGRDVWSLIVPSTSADEHEAIIEKPTMPTKPDLKLAKYQIRGTPTIEEIAAKQEVYREDKNQYQLDISEYNMQRIVHKEQQERLRTARSLLLSTITPAIRDSVTSKVSPSDVMDAVKALCKMSDSQALAFSYQKLDSVKYTDFASVSDLINSLTTYQLEIQSLSGTYGDEQIIAKVISLLPEAFSEFKRHWNFLSGSTSLPRTIHSLQSTLLGEEARLDFEGKLKKPATATGSKKKDNKKEGKKEDKDSSELHECKHCHRMVMHKEKNCWDNPDNKDKKPEWHNKQVNAVVAPQEPDNKKKKVTIAAAVFADRDDFQNTLDEAFKSLDLDWDLPPYDPAPYQVQSFIDDLAEAENLPLPASDDHELDHQGTWDPSGFQKTPVPDIDPEYSVIEEEDATREDVNPVSAQGLLSEDAFQHNLLATDLNLHKQLYGINNPLGTFFQVQASDTDSSDEEFVDALEHPTTADVIDREYIHHPNILTPPSPLANPLQVTLRGGCKQDNGNGELSGTGCALQASCDTITSQAEISPQILMMLNKQSVKSSIWIVDSGANVCIVNDKSLFTDFRALTYKIGTADDDAGIQIKGGGKVTISLCVDGEETADLTLTAVAYAPKARCNILSLSWVAEKSGLQGNWSKANITLIHDDEVIGIAPLIDGLYQLQTTQLGDSTQLAEAGDDLVMATHESDSDDSEEDGPSPFFQQQKHTTANTPGTPDDDSSSSRSESESSSDEGEVDDDALPDGVLPPEVEAISLEDYDSHPVWRLHRALGHLGFANMRLLLKMSNGIDVTDDQIKLLLGKICPVCATAKAVKHIPKEPARRRETHIGGLIHVDAWGPYPIASWNGQRWILVFTDDATRRSWCAGYASKRPTASRVPRHSQHDREKA